MKTLIRNLLLKLKGQSNTTTNSKDTIITCPPPGATVTKVIWIVCFYVDSQGNSGWCILM